METRGFRLGIDEAGYGPTLGPLTVGLVRLDGGSLEGPIAGLPPHPDLPPIGDSKDIFRGPRGLMRLEITALAALELARGHAIHSVQDLLGEEAQPLEEHPWYRNLDLKLPCAASREAVKRAVSGLAAGLGAVETLLSVATAAVVPTGAFNRRLASLDNKAQVELEVIDDLLDHHLPLSGPGMVFCDRLGGRRYYGPWLASRFPLVPVNPACETRDESRYEVQRDAEPLNISFLVGGERRSFEIALASCIAKYHRELMMLLFNQYWSARLPGLRPTAGYPQDARRFLQDIAEDPVASEARHLLARER